MCGYSTLQIINRQLLSRVFVLSMSLFYTIAVAASEREELIQEVFKSDLVFPQQAGEIQLSLLPEYAESDEETSWAVPVSVEYGITDNLQVEFEWVSYGHNNPDDEGASAGIGNLEIGLQYSWLAIADSPFHAAVGVEFGLPLGDDDKELGEGEKSLGSYFIFAVDVADNTHAFVQFGVEYPEHETRERYANLGVISSVTDDVSLTLEYNWEEEAQYLTPGVVWSPIDDWGFAIGVPIGLGDEANDFELILHIILEMDT
jgi:hypothetical protein